jgi:hypothetical protein
MRWWESAGMSLADVTDAVERAEMEAAPIKRIEAADGTCVVACHDLAEISEAHAKLIVAAPKLLEALRAIFALQGDWDSLGAAQMIAQAAIKEAGV